MITGVYLQDGLSNSNGRLLMDEDERGLPLTDHVLIRQSGRIAHDLHTVYVSVISCIRENPPDTAV